MLHTFEYLVTTTLAMKKHCEETYLSVYNLWKSREVRNPHCKSLTDFGLDFLRRMPSGGKHDWLLNLKDIELHDRLRYVISQPSKASLQVWELISTVNSNLSMLFMNSKSKVVSLFGILHSWISRVSRLKHVTEKKMVFLFCVMSLLCCYSDVGNSILLATIQEMDLKCFFNFFLHSCRITDYITYKPSNRIHLCPLFSKRKHLFVTDSLRFSS